MTDRELVRRIERSAGQRAGYKQLVRELGLGGGRERRLLVEHLNRLTAGGQLIKLGRDHWSIPHAAATRENLVAGRLDLHREGYGFVRPEVRQASGNDDIFVPPGDLNGAMQGDQVLVELAPPRADGRRLGRIARILTRRNATVVGKFHYARSEHDPGNYVRPFDERMTQPVLIPFGAEIPDRAIKATPHRVFGQEAQAAAGQFEDLEGLIVDVEITDWPTPTRPARGRVIEILGDEDAFGVDVEMMIRKHHLPHVFPENVLREAREAAGLDGRPGARLDSNEVARLDPDEVAGRRDFRDLPIVTIDGETAKDFDDAVLVIDKGNRDGYESNGYELQVHIADVAEYVQPMSDLDLEARIRGTSVYFPDRAIPMLPQELSTNICSLRPKEDRLVLSCIMQISADGEVESYEICEGVICSAGRMTYNQVHAIIDGDPAMREKFAPMVGDFERMKTLALLLNAKRQRRGSIDFDLPEPIIEFDQFGAMVNVTRSVRNWAHRLIEEFMLSANECVATWTEQLGVPSIYRIHEKPDPKRVIDFEETAAGFGYSLGFGALPVRKVQMKSDRREQKNHSGRDGGRNPRQHEIPEDIPVTPRMYQKLSEKIAGKPEERIVSYLMLRSLKQARYSEKNEGHFALAASSYTHFTSPIRRYPDLIVHRVVKALLAEGVSGAGHLHPEQGRNPWSIEGTKSGSKPPAHQERRPVRDVPPAEFHQAKDALPTPIPESELAAIAQETSQTERRADGAERELVEWKKIKFMTDRVGEDFDAMILNATKFGIFVELDDLFVEGLVPIDSLRDDRYTYRENTRQIIGDRNGRKFSAGERVRVVLDRVNAVERRLQFSLRDEAPVGPRKQRPQAASAPKKVVTAKSGKGNPGKYDGRLRNKNAGKKNGKRKRK